MIFRPRFTPFSKKARHVQKEAWIRLRGKIRQRYGKELEPVFLFRHQDEPERPKLWNQWADIFILGLDGHTLWNASLQTVRRAFWTKLQEEACEAVLSRLTEEEKKAYWDQFSFDRLFVRIPGTRNWTLNPRQPLSFSSLDGQNFEEAAREMERALLINRPPEVFENWTLHPDYRYGIGLHAVLEVDEITPLVCLEFVRRFRRLGEKAYRSPLPAQRFLPDQIEEDALGTSAAWASSRPIAC